MVWIRKSKACHVWRSRVRREEEAGRTRREKDMARMRMRSEKSREPNVVGDMKEGVPEVVTLPVRGSWRVIIPSSTLREGIVVVSHLSSFIPARDVLRCPR